MVFALTLYLDQGAWLFAAGRTVLVAGGISFAIVAVAIALLRDRVHGALAGLCIIAMLFVYESPSILALLACIAGLIVVDGLVLSSRWRAVSLMLGWAYRVIGVFGLALLLVIVVQFGVRGQITGFSAGGATAEAAPGVPDIWLLLLDGHPRADTLEREWSLDASRLTEGLQGLGFSIADEARSNYNMTKLTLPAMLDMALLQDLEPWSGYEKPVDAPPAERVLALQHNRAFELLRDNGYHITSISAGYTHEDIRTADDFIDAGTADVVELHLLGMTALGAALQGLDPRWGEHQVGRRVEANLETLAGLAGEESTRPRFVFGHIPAPHPPYAFATVDRPTVPLSDVFDYQDEYFGDALMREVYREHVAAVDDRVLLTLGTIVEAIGDHAVIVVMSDHGSRPDGHDGLTPEEAEEQFSILLAARTPDGRVLFEDDAMATDVFSTVANTYLGENIPYVERVFQAHDGVGHPE